MHELSVIVPTYREADNLPVLVPRIHQATTGAGIDAEIIIVDDNSADGTEAVCEILRERFPVRLIVRKEERGLSSAVIAGMRAASSEILLVMDADLSHPPEKIPELVDALQDPETGFVIGSRYVSGGSTAEDWGFFQRLNSKVATWLARPFTSVKDPMAGFFALRKETFHAAEDILDPIGYKIGLELIIKCRCQKVVERPIAFAKRLKGQAKRTFREQLNYLLHLKRLLEYQHAGWAYFAKFVLVGFSGMLVDLSSFTLLRIWIPIAWARGIAIWIAMTSNFIANRRFTFSYARNESALRQYLGFCASCLLGATVNWSTSMALLAYYPFFAENSIAAAVVGVAAGTIFNYVLCRDVVFPARQGQHRGPRNTSSSKEADEDFFPAKTVEPR